MKLFKISQTTNNQWDTYSDAIVAAETEEEARNIHPDEPIEPGKWDLSSWTLPENVTVEYIGEAKEGTIPGIILSSFHAG